MSSLKDRSNATRLRGRPTQFQPEYAAQAAKLCDLGATDGEIAAFFGVSVRTLHRWKLEHPELCHSIKGAKGAADERVERSLYQKAIGYEIVEQRAIKLKPGPNEERVELVEVRRHVAADTTAAIFWLKNRRPEAWREKSQVEVTSHIASLSDEELEREIQQLLSGHLPAH